MTSDLTKFRTPSTLKSQAKPVEHIACNIATRFFFCFSLLGAGAVQSKEDVSKVLGLGAEKKKWVRAREREQASLGWGEGWEASLVGFERNNFMLTFLTYANFSFKKINKNQDQVKGQMLWKIWIKLCSNDFRTGKHHLILFIGTSYFVS